MRLCGNFKNHIQTINYDDNEIMRKSGRFSWEYYLNAKYGLTRMSQRIDTKIYAHDEIEMNYDIVEY